MDVLDIVHCGVDRVAVVVVVAVVVSGLDATEQVAAVGVVVAIIGAVEEIDCVRQKKAVVAVVAAAVSAVFVFARWVDTGAIAELVAAWVVNADAGAEAACVVADVVEIVAARIVYEVPAAAVEKGVAAEVVRDVVDAAVIVVIEAEAGVGCVEFGVMSTVVAVEVIGGIIVEGEWRGCRGRAGVAGGVVCVV